MPMKKRKYGSSRDHRWVSVATLILLVAASPVGASAVVDNTVEPTLLYAGGTQDTSAEAANYSPILLVGRIRYTVAPGDTLFGIALEYDVSVADIRRWNNLSGDSIRPGQELVLHVRGGSSQVRIEHEVESGDTGLGIALKYGVRLDALRRWNPRANLDRLRIGQELYVYVQGSSRGGSGSGSSSGSSDPSSMGSPNRGRLLNGIALADGPGIDVRYQANAYGMPVTVDAIRYAYGRLLAVYPLAPRVEVGDLSLETGGRMSPHRSHQNGLDADIAYFTKDAAEFCEFEAISADQLDPQLQWYLFELWIEWGAVEYLFVDYDLQQPLYEYAASQGYSEQQLSEWFQYPRGKSSRVGLIRHERGHDDHFHVRFVEGAQIATSQ